LLNNDLPQTEEKLQLVIPCRVNSLGKAAHGRTKGTERFKQFVSIIDTLRGTATQKCHQDVLNLVVDLARLIEGDKGLPVPRPRKRPDSRSGELRLNVGARYPRLCLEDRWLSGEATLSGGPPASTQARMRGINEHGNIAS